MRFLNLDLECLSTWPTLKPTQLFLSGYVKRICESKSKKVQAKRIDGWTWIEYDSLLLDMPSLNIGYSGLKDAMNGLVASGLVERMTRNFEKSRRSYFQIAQAYYDRAFDLDHADVKDSQGQENPLEDDSQGGKNLPDVGGKNLPVNAEVGGKNRQDRILDRKLGPEEENPPPDTFITRMEEKAGKFNDSRFRANVTAALLTNTTDAIERSIDYRLAHGKNPLYFQDELFRFKARESKTAPDEPIIEPCPDCGSLYQVAGKCPYCEEHPPARVRFHMLESRRTA